MGRGGVLILIRKCSGIIVKTVTQTYVDFLFLVINFKQVSSLSLSEDILLGCIYVAPESSVLYNFIDESCGIMRLESALNDILAQYGEMSIFLTGDFNSRIGKENDYVEDDSLLDLCGDGYISDTSSKNRTSRDTVVNNFGLSLLSLCKTFDIHILNGRNDKDQYGEFTCETVHGRSVVDYITVSTTLFDSVI